MDRRECGGVRVTRKPGAKGGVRAGDVLTGIRDLQIESAAQADASAGDAARMDRGEILVPARRKAVRAESDRRRSRARFHALLSVRRGRGVSGHWLFVYFRRGNAPRALHFFLMCLTSFILSTFHYTGKLNYFDQSIYLGNVVSGFLAPTLFLHFCCVFPEPQRWIRHKAAALAVYLPGIALLVLQLDLYLAGCVGRATD